VHLLFPPTAKVVFATSSSVRYLARITQKKTQPFFFYRIRGKGGTWVTEETVRFRRLADLKLNQLNEFGLGGGSRAPSAYVLVYLLN